MMKNKFKVGQLVEATTDYGSTRDFNDLSEEKFLATILDGPKYGFSPGEFKCSYLIYDYENESEVWWSEKNLKEFEIS